MPKAKSYELCNKEHALQKAKEFFAVMEQHDATHFIKQHAETEMYAWLLVWVRGEYL